MTIPALQYIFKEVLWKKRKLVEIQIYTKNESIRNGKFMEVTKKEVFLLVLHFLISLKDNQEGQWHDKRHRNQPKRVHNNER